MNTSKIRKILVGLLVLGALSAALSTGTFATFNATTTNAGSVTTAVLVMGNKVGAGAECTSSGAAISSGNSAPCNAVFSNVVTSGTSNTNITQTVAIRDIGNYTAAPTLTLTSSACANNSAGFTDTTGTIYAGSQNLCTGLPFAIHDDTAGTCIYGANPGTTCDPQGSISAAITALNALNTGAGYQHSLAAGSTETFTFKVQVPSTLTNDYQGRQAAFTLTWVLQ